MLGEAGLLEIGDCALMHVFIIGCSKIKKKMLDLILHDEKESRKRAREEELQWRFPVRLASFCPTWCTGLDPKFEEPAFAVFSGGVHHLASPDPEPNVSEELELHVTEGTLVSNLHAIESISEFAQEFLAQGLASSVAGNEESIQRLRDNIIKALTITNETEEKLEEALSDLMRRSVRLQENVIGKFKYLELELQHIIAQPELNQSLRALEYVAQLRKWVKESETSSPMPSPIQLQMLSAHADSDETYSVDEMFPQSESVLDWVRGAITKIADYTLQALGSTSTIDLSASADELNMFFTELKASCDLIGESLKNIALLMNIMLTYFDSIYDQVKMTIEFMENETLKSTALWQDFTEWSRDLLELIHDINSHSIQQDGI